MCIVQDISSTVILKLLKLLFLLNCAFDQRWIVQEISVIALKKPHKLYVCNGNQWEEQYALEKQKLRKNLKVKHLRLIILTDEDNSC